MEDRSRHHTLTGWFLAMFGTGLVIVLAYLAVLGATEVINEARGPAVAAPQCPTAQSEAIQATWAVDDPREGC